MRFSGGAAGIRGGWLPGGDHDAAVGDRDAAPAGRRRRGDRAGGCKADAIGARAATGKAACYRSWVLEAYCLCGSPATPPAPSINRLLAPPGSQILLPQRPLWTEGGLGLAWVGSRVDWLWF